MPSSGAMRFGAGVTNARRFAVGENAARTRSKGVLKGASGF
jgi:hypothetical protein